MTENKYELCLQAQTLMNSLKDKMWVAAYRFPQEYSRIERLYLKAFQRYERRYKSLYSNEIR